MTTNDETGGLIAALVLTLDQHFSDFLHDFEQNAARVCDLMNDRKADDDPYVGDALITAGEIARLVLAEDRLDGHRRGER